MIGPVFQVRFKTPAMKSWSEGKMLHVTDGEAEIAAAYNGNLRTIDVRYVEVASVGPRGGAVWLPLAGEA